MSFSILESKLKDILHFDSLNKDILYTLELHSDSNGYNNATLLLSDNNNFPGFMYYHFIEVVSSRGLSKGVREEKYIRGGISIFRNLIIGIVLYRFNIIEKFGTVSGE